MKPTFKVCTSVVLDSMKLLTELRPRYFENEPDFRPMHTKFECLLSKSLTTLEVMSYYLVVHTGPAGFYPSCLLVCTYNKMLMFSYLTAVSYQDVLSPSLESRVVSVVESAVDRVCKYSVVFEPSVTPSQPLQQSLV